MVILHFNNIAGVKATVVYPATDKHIEKYSICQRFLINETPELYEQITLPYITSSQHSLEVSYLTTYQCLVCFPRGYCGV